MNRSRNLTFNVQIWSIIYNKQNVFNSFKKYLCNLKIAKKNYHLIVLRIMGQYSSIENI